MASRQITLSGVRVNNLKDVGLMIPHGQWLSICGVSGSGKTSLAIDTLYAEGMRRYLESLSPGQRQFIGQLDRPDADRIEEIPPAIAVQPTRGVPSKQATVGSSTDLLPHFRLLFAKAGVATCPTCKVAVTRHHVESVTRWCCELPEPTRYMVAFTSPAGDQPLAQRLLIVRQAGFSRISVGGQMVNLSDASTTIDPGIPDNATVTVIVDRLAGGSDAARVRDSVATAFQYGRGVCQVLSPRESGSSDDELATGQESIDGRWWQRRTFSRELTCSSCEFELAEPTPQLFNRQKAVGQCDSCEGAATVDGVPCADCSSTGRSPAALSFQVADRHLGEVLALEVAEVAEWVNRQCDAEQEATRSNGDVGNSPVAISLLKPIRSRLAFLCDVGVAYLSLDRPTRTLSSGERQRIALTSILGGTLVNMLYVLDEPTRGLHNHDLPSLVKAIERLHQRGNTMVVLDHHAQMIRQAQRVVEMGPGAGAEGGTLIFDGTVDQLLDPDASETGDFMAGRRGRVFEPERQAARGRLKLTGATGRNLRNLSVQFPLGCLCVVAGVSGSGKTSLVRDTLYGALCDRKGKPVEGTLPYEAVFGESSLDEIVLVDQSPIGRTARSNPVTYIGAFDDIRRVFAETLDAKIRNIKVSKFSFNVAGGRCDKCQGDGQLTIDMKFMTDVHIRCDQCRGTRYRDEVLAVKHRGKNIAQVLAMTVREAFLFFRGQPKVQYKLKSLIDVGLGYIQLGQSATKLSSGEAQRLKLAQYLSGAKSKRALFLMDEPTTGLHMSDVVRLADCFATLVSVGHSMIVVEHNLQLMQYADWIIDLGPGAAAAGGQVVAEGTPEQIAASKNSVTGRYLKSVLNGT